MLVGIIFRIANFIIIMALATYLFKKKGHAFISKSMAKEEANHIALLNEYASLEQEQAHLTTLLQQEALLCEQFKIKIDEWKKKANIEHEQQKKERQERMNALHKKMMQRTELREHDLIAKQVAQQLVPALQKTLADHFKNEKMGIQYLNSITRYMNERVS
jgi:hypothetical protein